MPNKPSKINVLPVIVIKGVAAIRSARPIYVLNPQQGWIPGDGLERARAARMDPSSLWIYGAELPIMPGYQRDLANPSITRTVVSRIGARVSPSLPHDRRVVRAMVPQW